MQVEIKIKLTQKSTFEKTNDSFAEILLILLTTTTSAIIVVVVVDLDLLPIIFVVATITLISTDNNKQIGSIKATIWWKKNDMYEYETWCLRFHLDNHHLLQICFLRLLLLNWKRKRGRWWCVSASYQSQPCYRSLLEVGNSFQCRGNFLSYILPLIRSLFLN